MAVLKGREKAIKDLTVGTNMEVKDATDLVMKLIEFWCCTNLYNSKYYDTYSFLYKY